MIYFADLHVHSRYSMATSSDSDLNNLFKWASLKGIDVVATGDFTHPAWREEIAERLEPDESGLFSLKKCFTPEDESFPMTFRQKNVRFILNVEISSIYRTKGRVRKIHNLVFMPDIDSMNRFCKRLNSVGNLNSDGRPILGISARNLLEIALEASEQSFVVPAHIWTPWFSLLGAKSGFDSVEECFEDLSKHIFALETGLSSDPDMNRLVSSLDHYTLISNSDTHSPSKLAREANIFSGKPGYSSIRDSLKKGGEGISISSNGQALVSGLGLKDSLCHEEDNFIGTIEFFPELGKYHWDGHKKCGYKSNPLDVPVPDARCPRCGRPLTIGVMNRVSALADRQSPQLTPKSGYFWKMIPLIEIISAALKAGQRSKKVNLAYFDMLSQLGPEIKILWETPIDEISRVAPLAVVETIEKVRKHQVIVDPGYDGQYGKINI